MRLVAKAVQVDGVHSPDLPQALDQHEIADARIAIVVDSAFWAVYRQPGSYYLMNNWAR